MSRRERRRLRTGLWVLVSVSALTAGCSGSGDPLEPHDPGTVDAGEGDVVSATDADRIDAEVDSAEVCAPAGQHPPRPLVADLQRLGVAPPPVSGGTLAVSADGLLAVAADPDRDQVYVVDLAARTLQQTVALQAGDEPGRLVLDADGRAHVALRGGGAVASIDLATGEVVDRRVVCDLPRGIAHDTADDSLYVGCYEGRVVRLAASGGEPARRYELETGVRDVLVRGGVLRVTRFREAELLTLDSETGARMGEPTTPPSFALEAVDTDSCETVVKRFEPALSWRAVAAPDGSIMMLHQRQQITGVPTDGGGYGAGPFCESGVVQTVLTCDTGDGAPVSAAVPAMAMAVDVAVSADGSRVAIGGPGNAAFGSQVAVLEMADYLARAQGAQEQAQEAFGERGCAREVKLPPVSGEVISVAFDPEGNLLVQSREPSTLQLIDRAVLDGQAWASVDVVLGADSRRDTGHQLFHYNTSGGIACASCHAEAGDDGHVWTFEGVGARRTQSLSGGLLGTEPLHWQGDMKDFYVLFDEVFLVRMTGPPLERAYVDALAAWVDSQPSPARTPSDVAAVERGRALFESTEVGCAKCHSGPRLTDNATVDVGTGGALQVPSLTGLSFRAPFIHDGCAETLRDRFGECGGGDRHGKTSQLQESELDDLVAYLESL